MDQNKVVDYIIQNISNIIINNIINNMINNNNGFIANNSYSFNNNLNNDAKNNCKFNTGKKSQVFKRNTLDDNKKIYYKILKMKDIKIHFKKEKKI